jgi:hypothetical protein
MAGSTKGTVQRKLCPFFGFVDGRPMRTKANPAVPRDYVTLLAIVAMLLSVAVLAGIFYTYQGRRDTGANISVRIAPNYQKLPSDP